MITGNMWATLSKAAPLSRVVIQLTDGTEVDVESVNHYCGLVVITPDEPLSIHDAPEVDIEPFREVLEEFDGLTPDVLRALLESNAAGFDEMAGMLCALSDAEIDSATDVRGMIEIYNLLNENGVDSVDELRTLFESHEESVADMAAMLAHLQAQGVSNVDELIARLK